MKASVNPSRYSYEFIYTNIVGDMGESNDCNNGILLQNIDKETPINFSLLTTPIQNTLSKTSTITKLENYINENYEAGDSTRSKAAASIRNKRKRTP